MTSTSLHIRFEIHNALNNKAADVCNDLLVKETSQNKLNVRPFKVHKLWLDYL